MRHRPQACRGGLRYRAGCTGGTFTPQTPWPGVSLTSGESREALCPRRGWGVSPAFGRKSETRSGRELTLVFPFRRRFKMGWALPFHANEFIFENSSWGQFDFYKGGRFGQKPPRGGDSAVSSHSQKDNEFRENCRLPAGSQACIKHLPSDRHPRGLDGGARAEGSGGQRGKGPTLSDAVPPDGLRWPGACSALGPGVGPWSFTHRAARRLGPGLLSPAGPQGSTALS